jgi:SagB-type dehydrogenase family enzyme
MKSLLSILIRFILLLPLLVSISIAQETKDISLPAPVKTGGKPLMDALNLRSSARDYSNKMLTNQEISDLLWAANGINRPESGKKTAPTAMNWQDLEVYVCLPEGIYLYMPKENILKMIKEGNFMKDCGKQNFVDDAPINLIFVSDLGKMKIVKNEDKLLYAGIHAGAVSQNVYLYCASVGLNTVTRRYMDIEKLSKIMELPADQVIVLSQTVGYKP